MSRSRLPLAVILGFFLAAAWPSSARAVEADAATIGVVRRTTGDVTLYRAGKASPAAAGMKLRAGDSIETGGDGSIGVILRDDTLLALGPKSALAIDSFLFAPKEGKLGLVARLSRGTLDFFTGLVGKLSPESVRIDTPVSSIGIRGTHFVVSAGTAGGE